MENRKNGGPSSNDPNTFLSNVFRLLIKLYLFFHLIAQVIVHEMLIQKLYVNFVKNIKNVHKIVTNEYTSTNQS